MVSVNITETRKRMNELIDRALAGEEVIIMRQQRSLISDLLRDVAVVGRHRKALFLADRRDAVHLLHPLDRRIVGDGADDGSHAAYDALDADTAGFDRGGHGIQAVLFVDEHHNVLRHFRVLSRSPRAPII
jgi:antitoxin (DNA-binding transcriptional repressor) of toxin-antitoxin stability system